MLPFPMFRLRQSRPHPQLPSASIQYLPVPATCARHLPRSARHSSTCDLASILPPVTSHASPITNSFRIRTSEKRAPNPFRIRTSKTQDLKPFRMNTSEKTPGGEALLANAVLAPCAKPLPLRLSTFDFQPSAVIFSQKEARPNPIPPKMLKWIGTQGATRFRRKLSRPEGMPGPTCP